MRVLGMVVIFVFIFGCSRGESQPRSVVATMPESQQAKRSEKELILDAVLQDLVSNPDLKSTRDFYGTDGENHLVLIDDQGSVHSWPTEYQPILPGWKVTRDQEGVEWDPQSTRRLGVRIDKYSLETDDPMKVLRGPIEVAVLNAGGNQNGIAVIGGFWVFYRPKLVDGKWVVEFLGAEDP